MYYKYIISTIKCIMAECILNKFFKYLLLLKARIQKYPLTSFSYQTLYKYIPKY